MIYKDFQDLKLSTLGFGGMRLPIAGQRGPIDEKKTAEMVEYAYKNGVNYFDTAFFYHGGESERFLGKALSKFPRDTWYFADKLPGNFIEFEDGRIKMELEAFGMGNKEFDSYQEIFEYQLDNSGAGHFDFYMLHNVTETTFELYTDEKLGIINYLLEQKKAGRIRHLGFSTHGRYETIDKFLDMYDCFEFVLMQLNYLDWSLQEAKKKYDIITRHGLPIFVMEPVRGGKLSNPGEKAEDILKAANPNETPASWAFRFLKSLPNVSVVVSGMSTMEQLKENIEIFNNEDSMSEEEKAVLWQVVDTMASFVPCTSCRYCCDICPQKLDIPVLIATYNEAANEFGWYVRDMLDSLTDEEKPQACIGCGACTPLCPQNIDIADILKKFSDLLASKED
jgi:predicted aldo/keto reductase-like oxidoreductase